MVSLVTICHHTKLLYNHKLYSTHCTFHAHDVFILWECVPLFLKGISHLTCPNLNYFNFSYKLSLVFPHHNKWHHHASKCLGQISRNHACFSSFSYTLHINSNLPPVQNPPITPHDTYNKIQNLYFTLRIFVIWSFITFLISVALFLTRVSIIGFLPVPQRCTWPSQNLYSCFSGPERLLL